MRVSDDSLHFLHVFAVY